MTPAKRRKQQAPPAYPGFVPVEKECRREDCSNMFLPPAPAAAYCSAECRDEATRAQRRETDKGKRKRRREREEAERDGKPVTRTCALEGCDAEFVPATPRSSYCSTEHRAEATRIIKARNRARARGEIPPAMPTSATQQAVALIERADEATGGEPVGLESAEYIAHLWKRVNEDPDCPPHIYDRLERLLGLTSNRSTIPH